MKKLTVVVLVCLLSFAQMIFASGSDRIERVNWNDFSDNLVKGLTIDNDGVRQAVLQHIITYSDYLDVNDAVFDIVKIYRTHKNDKFRQLAVVALSKTQNKWAMYFLKRNLKFEKNPTIKRQIIDGIHQYEQNELADKELQNIQLFTDILK